MLTERHFAAVDFGTVTQSVSIKSRLIRRHPFVLCVFAAGSSITSSLHTAPSHEATPALRFEVEARYRQAGQADDAGWGAAREISIAVGDVDEAATGLALDVVTSSLAETRDTGARIKLADLVVTDPDRNADFRRHDFTPSNRAMFEIEDGVLYLKAGVALDHENATSHSVTVRSTAAICRRNSR